MYLKSQILSSLLAVAACFSYSMADEVPSKLARYMEAVAEVKNFNGSVSVAQNGVSLLSEGYGYANAEHQVVNTSTTKFRIGSITKQFTAMAVMILDEQGQLNVLDPISKHLKEAPETWDQVTIHQLLTHTSGIPSFTSMADYGPKMMLRQTTQDMINRFVGKPLNFAPGEEFRYSNSGYFLLGAIVEAASGQSYEAFLNEAIFLPLQLDDTGYDHFRKVLPNRATGYVRRGGKLVHAEYLDMSQPYAAGSLYSTVEDLQKWDRALHEGRLLSPEGYRKMWTAEKNNYAYGWHVETDNGVQTISHGGGINGFRSFFVRFPDTELSVAVLCNVEPSNPSPVANALAAIALGEDVELPTAREVVQVDKQLLQMYQGKYQLQPDMVLIVTLDGDKLMAAPEGQPGAKLEPESSTAFFVPDVDAKLTFITNEEGKVVAAVLKQGGQETRAARLSAE